MAPSFCWNLLEKLLLEIVADLAHASLLVGSSSLVVAADKMAAAMPGDPLAEQRNISAAIDASEVLDRFARRDNYVIYSLATGALDRGA